MAKGKEEQSNRAGQVLFTFHVDPSSLVITPAFIDEVFKNQAGLTCFKLRDDFIQEPDSRLLQEWIEQLHVASALYDNMDVISMQETAVSAQKNPTAVQRWGRAINHALSTSSKTTTPRFQQLVQSVIPTKQAQLVIDMFRTERDNVLYPLESHFAFYLNNQEIVNINDILGDPFVSEQTLSFQRDALREMAEAIESEFDDITQLEIKQVDTRNKDGVLQVISVTSCDTWFVHFQGLRGELKRLEQNQEELVRGEAGLQENLLRLNAKREGLLQMDQETQNEIDELNLSLNALSYLIDTYQPKPVIDFFIFIFGLTLLGFKTYQQEQQERIAAQQINTSYMRDAADLHAGYQTQLETNNQQIIDTERELGAITWGIEDISARCNKLLVAIDGLTRPAQEENDLSPTAFESESESESDSESLVSAASVGSVPDDIRFVSGDIHTPPQPEPQLAENSALPKRPAHPLFGQAQLGAQLKKTTPPVVDEPSSNKPSALLKKTGLSLKMSEQIAAKSRTLNTSYMLLSVQAISENSTKEQIIQDFNKFFEGQLNGLSATIVDNEVRLPITNQIDIERFSQWCESQVSRFNRQQVAVVPAQAKPKTKTVMSNITDRRAAISNDDDMSTNDVDSQSVFARPIFDAFNNRLPHFQKSLKANAEKKAASGNEPVTKVTRLSSSETPSKLTIFIPQDNINKSYSSIETELQKHSFTFNVQDGQTTHGFGKQIVLSDITKELANLLIGGLSQLRLPKTVLVQPFMPFGKQYLAMVEQLEQSSKIENSKRVEVVLVKPEPTTFLKIITGLETPCADIDNLFTGNQIIYEQYEGSYYLNKEAAESLADLTSQFVAIVTNNELRGIGLYYLLDGSEAYQHRRDIELEFNKTNNHSQKGPSGFNLSMLSRIQAQEPTDPTDSDSDWEDEQSKLSPPVPTTSDDLLNGFLGVNIARFDKTISEAKQLMTRTMVRNIGQQPSAAPAPTPASLAPKQPRNNSTFFVAAQPTVLLEKIQRLFEAKDAPLPSERIKFGLLMKLQISLKEFVSCIPSQMVQEIREIDDVETAVYPEDMQTTLSVDDALMKKIHQWLLNHPEFQPDESSQVRSNP
jgi:hypothetical protein